MYVIFNTWASLLFSVNHIEYDMVEKEILNNYNTFIMMMLQIFKLMVKSKFIYNMNFRTLSVLV